jgi:hypothetical protein
LNHILFLLELSYRETLLLYQYLSVFSDSYNTLVVLYPGASQLPS